MAKTVGCTYPLDLHRSRNIYNKDNVDIMEEEIKNTLKEFIMHGTYKGAPVIEKLDEEILSNKNIRHDKAEQEGILKKLQKRKGEYRIVAMLYNGKGKSSLKVNGVDESFKENYASNLYTNMAYSTLVRLLFHDPFNLNIKRVRFDLPTRVVKVKEDSKEHEMFKDWGYKDNKYEGEDEITIQVANDFNYRTALDYKIKELNRLDLDIDRFSVRPIKYEKSAKDIAECKEIKTENYTFQYLADMICSLLLNNKKGDEELEWLYSFVDYSNKLNTIKKGKYKNLIFAYDDIDDYYERSISSFLKKEYYNALVAIFDGKENDSKFKEYYTKEWFREVETLIHNEKIKKDTPDGEKKTKIEAVEDAILNFFRLARSYELKQEKLVYLYEKLEPLVNSLPDSNSYKYKFYNAGISTYNHVGNSKKAEKCFELCKEYARHGHLEDYLSTLDRRVVMLYDQYKFEEALNQSLKILNCHNELNEQRVILENATKVSSIYKGRSLSQKGQVLAYMVEQETNQEEKAQKSEEVQKCFDDALKEFKDKSDDKFKTTSYLLHHYIDQNNEEEYSKKAKDYFGEKDKLWSQFIYLKTKFKKAQKDQSFKFAFFVFIKALYFFYAEDLKKEERSEILEWAKDLKEKDAHNHITGHPWELNYKYLALLALKWGDKDLAEAFKEEMINIVKIKGNAIANIITLGLMEYYTLAGDQQAAEKEEKKLIKNVGVDYKEKLVYICLNKGIVSYSMLD